MCVCERKREMCEKEMCVREKETERVHVCYRKSGERERCVCMCV